MMKLRMEARIEMKGTCWSEVLNQNCFWIVYFSNYQKQLVKIKIIFSIVVYFSKTIDLIENKEVNRSHDYSKLQP